MKDEMNETGKDSASGYVCMSYSPDDTFALGMAMGERAMPGQIICLNGELGAGKTVFTQGFAAGLGVRETVNSPTFTILQLYESGRIPLYHFDVYRLEEPEEMYEIGYEEYFFGEGVCLIEWSDRIAELIPEDVIYVDINKDLTEDFDYRRINVYRGQEERTSLKRQEQKQ